MDDTQMPTNLGRPFLFDAASLIMIVPFFLNLQMLLYSLWTAAVTDIFLSLKTAASLYSL